MLLLLVFSPRHYDFVCLLLCVLLGLYSGAVVYLLCLGWICVLCYCLRGSVFWLLVLF